MATNKITLDTGATIHTATYVITESALQVNIPRSSINNSAGAEVGINAAPFVVAVSGGTIATIAAVTAITNVVTVSSSTTIVAALPAGTNAIGKLAANTGVDIGDVDVLSLPAITGSVTAIGTTIAGTNSTNVLGIQGATNMIAVAITGSTTIASMPSITGSTTIASMPAITGSVAVVNNVVVGTLPSITGSTTIASMPAITGSVTVVGTLPAITGSTTLVDIKLPSSASVTFNVTTAGTTNLIPSTATGAIVLTDLVVSNGLNAGSVSFGETNTTTDSNIKIQPLYFAQNGGIAWPIKNPIVLTDTVPLVMTAVSCTTLSVVATYYVR